MRSSTRTALIVGAPLLGIAALALVPRPVDLLVTNPGPRPVTVRVSGLDPVLVPPGTSARFEVAAGEQLLVASDGGATTSRVLASLQRSPLEARPTWVWSVAPIESAFYVVSRGYGDQEGLLEASPWTAPGPLFRLPGSEGGRVLLPQVDEDFPKQVPILPGETTGSIRAQLCTGAHLDRATGRHAVVIVKNPLGGRLQVRVDGAAAGELPPYGTLELNRPPGPIALEALELGPQGQPGRRFQVEATLELDAFFHPDAVWVWNVGGLEARFVVIGRLYGGDESALPRPGAFKPGAELFRLPADWYPHVDEPFPDAWRRRGALYMLWTFEHYAHAKMEHQEMELQSRHLGAPAPEAPPPEAPPPATPFPPAGPR